jgi:hypothetical protein
MNKTELLNRVSQELGLAPGALKEHTDLAAVKEWDSMGKMAVLTFLDTDLGVAVPQGAVNRCLTGADLVALAGEKVTGA